jgi:hypothetical protein
MNWALMEFSFRWFDAIHLSISAIQTEMFATTDEASSALSWKYSRPSSA